MYEFRIDLGSSLLVTIFVGTNTIHPRKLEKSYKSFNQFIPGRYMIRVDCWCFKLLKMYYNRLI